MKTMSKLAIALPALALLSACATSPTPSQHPPAVVPAEKATQVAYDRMMPERYTCGDAGDIMAKLSINKQQAMIIPSLNKLNMNQQSILLNQDTSASGVRYVNNSNPEATIAWHIKGDDAVFAINWANGQEYQAVCKKL